MTSKRLKYTNFDMQIIFIFFGSSKLLAANKPDNMLLQEMGFYIFENNRFR